MSTRPVRIAIVNDYDLVVAGLMAVLEPYADRVEVVELDSGQPVVSPVDLVLYDTFGQPQGDDVDLSSVASHPDARVVILSWNTDTSLVRRAVESGAAGYVTKAATAAALVDALERIHDGERVLLLGEADAIDSDALLGRWPGDLHGLSPREGEILALICQGLTNEEITGKAFIGMNTVKTHIRTLYRKIGADTRSQAVRWGMERGFTPDRGRVVLAPGVTECDPAETDETPHP